MFIGAMALLLIGSAASVRIGPLKPYVGPVAHWLAKWVREQIPAEAPPPPPQPIKHSDLPPHAVSLIQKEEAAAQKGKQPSQEVPHNPQSATPENTGWLSLDSTPPAQVFDGATELGVCPLFKIPLPAGAYRLRLVDHDGNNRSLSASVKAGELTTLKIQVADLPLED